MHLSEWFWLFTALWVLTSFWWGWGTPAPGRYPILGYSFLLLILIVILGWKTFGSAVQ